MYTMAEVKDIRDAYFEKGKNISQIAKEFGMDRKTVRKFIEREDWNEQPQRVCTRASVLDPYKTVIEQWLEQDRRERRKQRHTAKRVYQRLCEEYGEKGFDCSYRTVAAYVSECRQAREHVQNAALPLQCVPGEAQADFGEADFIENGERHSGYYVTVSFPHSNAGYLQLFGAQSLECLLTGLIAVFTFIGGVPSRLRLDNATTMVKKILGSGKRELTNGFARFCEHFAIEPVFCNPGRGNEKGNVENKVGYGRRNMLVPVPECESLEQFNRELLQRCEADGEREHYRREKHIRDLFEEDRRALRPLPSIEFDPDRYRSIRCDAYGMASLSNGTHRYSTSPRFARETVTVRIGAYRVTVLDDSLREVVTHNRLYGPQKQQRMDWLPYLSQLARRPTALKYSSIYEMMPEVLRAWIDRQPRHAVGKALTLISQLSERGGFDTACEAVADSLLRGITDADSLVALHDRMIRYTGLEQETEHSPVHIDSSKVRFDPSCYDRMIPVGRP